MEVYLVYEFIYHNYDEDIEENIEFIGLYRNEKEAKKVARKRIKHGIKECNVVLSKNQTNKKDPFEKSNCVDMYRKNGEMVYPIYSIYIEKFNVKGKDKNE